MQLKEVPSSKDRVILFATFNNIKPVDLYTYFSTPEGLTKWWPQEAEIDLKVGGGYALRWPAMNWTLSGKYTAVEAGKVLAYTWAWGHEPDRPVRDVSLVFSGLGDGTEVTLTHGFYDDSAEDQEDRQSHLDGWRHFLSQLEGVLTNQ